MILIIACIFLVLWLLGRFVFKIAGGMIHLLLVIAVIAILWHLFAGR